MSSDVILYCEHLKLALSSQDTKKASTYLDAIDHYFNDRISQNEIDLAVSKVFSEDGGVLGFVKLCLKQLKVFKSETVKSFELFVKIIELYPNKVPPYATNVVIICLQYIRSMHTSAREKDKAGAVIETLVVKNCCDDVDRIFLMDELLKVAQLSKPGTVQSRIFGLIGCLAKDYPDCIQNPVEDGVKIRDMYFKALESAVVNKYDTTLTALTGAFNGLNDFLENFTPSEQHKDVFAERVYKCIKPLAKPLVSTQKAVHRSALNLLANRCELFGKHIFADFFYWHDLLVNTWLKMEQFDNRRPAIHLLHSMHREISARLIENGDSDRSREILLFLQTYFKTTLESSKSQPFEVRLAIVGFGLIAAPCKKLLSPEHLNELLRLVMQRTESAANAVNHNDREQLEHFPDYVEALSRIMEQVDQLSSVQLHILQNIMVTVIRNFHLLSTAHHVVTVNTLMRTFHNLSQLGGSIVDDILEKVIYQGIIWTCSHKLPFDAKNDWQTETDWKNQITYVSYLPLWNGFLAEFETSIYNRSAIVSKIYDQMMQTLFKILDKLNLAVRKRIYRDDSGHDQELFFSDPNYDLEPVRVKDFHIFFNLVGFYDDVLKAQSLNSHKTHFIKWINLFIEEIISKSLRNPLVSGFVRLMQLNLRIANRLNYFGNELFEDSQTHYDDVYFYLTTCIRKAQQSSGELKIACLKLLFTAPTCMLCKLVHDMIPAFQIAFDIGKSNASLFIAGMALNAIERYLGSVNQTSNDVKTFLYAVLPFFDAYLQGFKNDVVKSVETARNRIQGAKRTAQKLIKVKENDLLKFQKRIILFLGTLEPECCMQVMRNNEDVTLVKWDEKKRVCLTLYGPNFNPKIYMDALMPRICEIATSTTDRQKKMTACEIIQATILYLLGSYNHRDRLWSELCKLMLELGCDGDVGVQQMFEPLVMQTMHYISRDDQLNQDGSEIVLKCLLNAISHPTNLAVRDLASRALREFLSWTFRQARPERLATSPFTIVKLLQELKMFNSDALHERRFGAALAFNNIYRVLREEDSIVDKYWLELLHDFCLNFKLSEQHLEADLNCQTDLKQVSASLDHILRVLRERKHVFNRMNPDRVKVVAVENALLYDSVVWLLDQCKSTHNTYRKKMMDMFVALAPCVDGVNSAAELIRKTQNIESVIGLCENGLKIENIESLPFDVKRAWLKQLHTSLDCYIWFIENNLMAIWKPIFEQNIIFETLNYYINNIMRKELFDGMHDMDYGLIVEKERINAEKSAILLVMLQFLNKTMSIGCAPDAIWQSNELIWVIETAMFRPQFLECDTRNPEFLSKLPKSLETFIVNVNRFSPAQFKTDLNNKLIQSTTDIYETLIQSIDAIFCRNSITLSETNNLNGVEIVCALIKAKNVPVTENVHINMDVLAGKVLYQIFDGIKEKQNDTPIAKTPSPDTLKFTSHLLRSCFNKDKIYINLIDLLMNTSDLQLYESLKVIKHGKHFYSLYKVTIHEYFFQNVDIIVERLISKILPPNVSYVLNILIEFTEFAYKTGSQNINQMKSLTNILLGNWSDILSRTGNDHSLAITTTLIELMGQIAMICPYELTEISKRAKGLENWLLNITNNDEFNIETKTQAIFLFPCLIGPTTYEHNQVQNALEKFQTKFFPLYTSELRPGSIDRTAFENAFQVILDTMCASKSLVMLKFIINCTAQDADHIMDQQIVQSLTKFMGSLKPEQQMICLNKVFEMFSSTSLDATIRMALMKRFLSPMILSSTKETVIQFYALHIRKIEQLLETPYGLDMSDFKLEQAFTSRIGGFQLLEQLVAIVTREEICDRTCPIVVAKFGDKVQNDSELLKWMSQKTSRTKSETFQTNNATHMEWFRKYQCATFKALCAIISNIAKIESQLKFFESFVFIEKNWWNMINTTDSNLYANQTLEVDKKPEIKKRMVSIRRSDDITPNRKYIETQNVFESSLSQDVTKIDLSSSYVRTADEVEQHNHLVHYQPKTLMLEKNSINDHEAMATVCAVIDHMFENDITPTNEDGTVRRHKLPWVENICNVIANKSNMVHMNIRIFLVTVVDNCSKRFRNYADVMTPAILKFLVDWTTTSGRIDALTIFLLVDLLEWDSVYRISKNSAADVQNLASNLMEMLMTHAHHLQREVFRRNLELIRNLMERWREFIQLPYGILLEKISDENPESKANVCGLHLNGIVLTNGLAPWRDESKNQFLHAISNCLNNTHSDVYNPAAQVLGMALHEIIVKQNDGNINNETMEFIGDIVKRLKSWKKTDEKRFMSILFYIDKYYVINEFVTTISNLIASSTSDLKRNYLQMFLSRVNDAEPRDIEVILIDLLTQSQEHQHQLLALHIFNKALPKLAIDQIRNIVTRITSFQDAKQSELRDVLYEIMKFIRENFGTDHELNQTATEILRKGLNDIDANLQGAIFKYWNELPELPATLNDRVLFLLRHMYSCDFLKYAVQLLIDLKSSDLKQKLLRDRADDDTKYTEYDINVDWKSQDSSIRVPLFTESQQKHIINSEIDQSQSYLRATQHTLHFDPTLDPSSVHQSVASFSLSSQSSLLIGGPVQVLDRRSQRTKSEEAVTQTKFGYLRSRILQDRNAASREQALNAVRRREQQKKEQTQQHRRKEGQVTLYRRYRYGDYPDFYINSLAFLLPLQVLVKLDVILARNTFVTIVNAIYETVDDRHTFVDQYTMSIGDIIKQPNQCDPMLFSAFTEITLSNAVGLNIDPEIVIAMPNTNDMMINAILLLENGLINSQAADGDAWSKLANMYYSLSEYDVTSSIFSAKIESDPLLSMAIESESNGDYQKALKLYMELINKSTATDMEYNLNKCAVDFCYQSVFKCYEVMGRWEDLESNVVGQITDDDDSQKIDFEQLWTDEWNAKYLLPHYIRSEVWTLIYSGARATRAFLTNIEQWLRNSTRVDFIKRHFGEELALLHVANNDYLQAKVFSNQYFEGFLNEWNVTSVLSDKMRTNKLMNTRRVAEIHQNADLLSRPIDDSVIADLADRWQRTQMNRTDSTQMWEALVSSRIFVSEHAIAKFEPKTAPIVGRLIESMFFMQFKLNEMAVQQQNIELSKIVLQRLNTFRDNYGHNTVKSVVQFELASIRQDQINWMNAKIKDRKIALQGLLDIWTNLRRIQDGRRNILDTNPQIQLKVFEQFIEIADLSNRIVSKSVTLDETLAKKIGELTSCWDDSKGVLSQIQLFSRRCCNETIALAEKYEQNEPVTNATMDGHAIGESYYRLALFNIKHLKFGTEANQLETAKCLIKSILRGMRYDSKNARLQFTRLLQLPNINAKELTDLFNEEVDQVPLFTFLAWITQIVSHFDFQNECFLDKLLLRLATAYPSAVIYSFQFSYNQAIDRHPVAREVVQHIMNAIKNPMLEQFIENVNCVSLPDKVIDYHLKNILDRSHSIEQNWRELKICCDNVFGCIRGTSVDKVQQFKVNLEQMMEINDHRQLREAALEMLEKLAEVKHDDKGYTETLSPWLARYHWYGGDNYIELPGQYTGKVAPNANNILKIVKFHEKVSIYHSLRRPIKLTAICSDGKSYSFLVKYGENLRQDERIQHIQELMSDQMKADKNCSQQKLSLRTYKVIPLNVDCGIISWVENTATIDSFLSQSDPEFNTANASALHQYRKFIMNAPIDKNKRIKPNVAAVLHYSPADISKNLIKLQNKLPENCMRKALYQLSASPECFFALRNNFIKSLAAMNTAHWMLGIGDRHLQNFVIDKNNGQLIGIDFNMAFGVATRKLSIPELMPFRLTKQFSDAMRPLENSGYLNKCMSHVLRTFRTESNSLMAALEVFICEPIKSHGRLLALSSDIGDSEEILRIIRSKLSGINPVGPIEKDLKAGVLSCDADVISTYTKILYGTANRLRYKMANNGLTVEEQVKCLIDLASDPTILGTSYFGFRPWV